MRGERNKAQYLIVLIFRRNLSQKSKREHTDKPLSKANSICATIEMANKRPEYKSAEADDVISNDASNDPTGHETDMIHGIVDAVKTGISANSDTKQDYPDVSSPKIAHDKYIYSGAGAMYDVPHTFHPHINKYREDVEQEKDVVSTPYNKDTDNIIVKPGLSDNKISDDGNQMINSVDESEPSPSGGRGKEYAILNHSLPSQDRNIRDALEYYAIEGNGSSDPCINPIEPFQRLWSDLHSFETIDYHGEDLMVGNIIGVKTQGSKDNSIVEIREIRGLEDGGFLLLVFWYCSKKEMDRSGCKDKKKWPRGHSHMKSTHMQIIMWDTTNCKMSTEESRKFSPGMIFNWSHADPFITGKVQRR